MCFNITGIDKRTKMYYLRTLKNKQNDMQEVYFKADEKTRRVECKKY
jgi:hypothetical protein